MSESPKWVSPRQEPAIGLGEYLWMLIRNWWILLVIAALLSAAGYAWATYQYPSYSASAVLMVNPSSTPGQIDPRYLQVANSMIGTYQEIITSQPVLSNVAKEIGWRGRVSALKDHFDAKNPINTQLLEINATFNDPQTSVKALNALIQGFYSWYSQRLRADIQSDLQQLNREIAQASAQVDDARAVYREALRSADSSTPAGRQEVRQAQLALAQANNTYQGLLQQRRDLQVQILSPDLGITTIIPAHLSGSPSRSSKILNTLAGLLIGLGLGSVLSVVKERARRRVFSKSQVEQYLGVQVLGDVKLSRFRRLDVESLSRTPSVRLIAAKIRRDLLGSEDRVGTISTTEDTDQQVKVAAAIAKAMSYTASRVLLVECATKKPSLTKVFDQDNDKHLRVGDSSPAVVSSIENLDLMLVPPASNSRDFSDLALHNLISDTKDVASFALLYIADPINNTNSDLLAGNKVDCCVIVTQRNKTLLSKLEETARYLDIMGCYVAGIVLVRETLL